MFGLINNLDDRIVLIFINSIITAEWNRRIYFLFGKRKDFQVEWILYLMVALLVSNVKKSDEVFYNHDETAISELRRVQQSGVSKLITVEIRFIIVFTRFIKLDGRSGKNFQHVGEQCGILYSMDKFFGLKRLKRRRRRRKIRNFIRVYIRYNHSVCGKN